MRWSYETTKPIQGYWILKYHLYHNTKRKLLGRNLVGSSGPWQPEGSPAVGLAYQGPKWVNKHCGNDTVFAEPIMLWELQTASWFSCNSIMTDPIGVDRSGRPAAASVLMLWKFQWEVLLSTMVWNQILCLLECQDHERRMAKWQDAVYYILSMWL